LPSLDVLPIELGGSGGAKDIAVFVIFGYNGAILDRLEVSRI